MKFKREELTGMTYIQYVEHPFSKCRLVRKGTNDVMQSAGRLQNTDLFVFKNISKNAYCEYTQEDVHDKLCLEVPTLEIGDWIAVWQPATGNFAYLLIHTDEDAKVYNNLSNWRQVTQEELEQLNKSTLSCSPQPISLSLSIEEATKVLQERIEKAVAEAVKEAIREWKKKRDIKFTNSSTEKQCEDNWYKNEFYETYIRRCFK